MARIVKEQRVKDKSSMYIEISQLICGGLSLWFNNIEVLLYRKEIRIALFIFNFKDAFGHREEHEVPRTTTNIFSILRLPSFLRRSLKFRVVENLEFRVFRE